MPQAERVGSVCYSPFHGLMEEIWNMHDLYTPGLHTYYPHQELPSEVWKKAPSKDCVTLEKAVPLAPREPHRVPFAWQSTTGHFWASSPEGSNLWSCHCHRVGGTETLLFPGHSQGQMLNTGIRINNPPQGDHLHGFDQWISPCANLHGKMNSDQMFRWVWNQEGEPVMWCKCSVAQGQTAWWLFLPNRLNPMQFPKGPRKGLFLN